MAWLSGYTYRQEIPIKRVGGAVALYQMKLNVHKGAGNSLLDDCYLKTHALSWTGTVPNDIRFTNLAGAELDYWIESSDANDAVVWIEFDSIGTTDTDFYVYYGKADDTTTSDGADTFLFFDDFPGDAIDTDKWNITADFGVVASSILTLVGNNTWRNLDSKITLGQATGALRIYANIETDVTSWGMGLDTYSTEAHRAVLGGSEATPAIYSKDGTTQSFLASNHTWNAWKKWDIIVRGGTNSSFFENGVEQTNSPKTTNPPNSATLGVGADLRTDTKHLYIDWCLLRNYVYPEPTWETWGSEEALVEGTAAGSGVGLATSSSLLEVLAAAAASGIGLGTSTSLLDVLATASGEGVGLGTGSAYLIIPGSASGSGVGLAETQAILEVLAQAQASGVGLGEVIGIIVKLGAAAGSGVGVATVSALLDVLAAAAASGEGLGTAEAFLEVIAEAIASGVGEATVQALLEVLAQASASGIGIGLVDDVYLIRCLSTRLAASRLEASRLAVSRLEKVRCYRID